MPPTFFARPVPASSLPAAISGSSHSMQATRGRSDRRDDDERSVMSSMRPCRRAIKSLEPRAGRARRARRLLARSNATRRSAAFGVSDTSFGQVVQPGNRTVRSTSRRLTALHTSQWAWGHNYRPAPTRAAARRQREVDRERFLQDRLDPATIDLVARPLDVELRLGADGQAPDGGWEIALMRAANELILEAEGADICRGAGEERDDARNERPLPPPIRHDSDKRCGANDSPKRR